MHTTDIFNEVKSIINDCDETNIVSQFKAVRAMKELFGVPDEHRQYVYAVRIYYVDGYKLMADLALGDGGRPNGDVVTIEWDCVTMRQRYCINGYTFIFDERDVVKKLSFQAYVNQEYDL